MLHKEFGKESKSPLNARKPVMAAMLMTACLTAFSAGASDYNRDYNYTPSYTPANKVVDQTGVCLERLKVMEKDAILTSKTSASEYSNMFPFPLTVSAEIFKGDNNVVNAGPVAGLVKAIRSGKADKVSNRQIESDCYIDVVDSENAHNNETQYSFYMGGQRVSVEGQKTFTAQQLKSGKLSEIVRQATIDQIFLQKGYESDQQSQAIASVNTTDNKVTTIAGLE
ncbi:MAG: hypothetical protein CBB87_07035 [Micavibrio sp. TMED27]|nr:hypothetical protein [Micavibrio sp.]OUT91066.1 MAG: hypothetical protein CBB87_07035 [Micavibrio sp. TMED27]